MITPIRVIEFIPIACYVPGSDNCTLVGYSNNEHINCCPGPQDPGMGGGMYLGLYPVPGIYENIVAGMLHIGVWLPGLSTKRYSGALREI